MDGIADSPNTVLGFLWVRQSGLSGGLTRGVLQFVCKLRRGNVGILILCGWGEVVVVFFSFHAKAQRNADCKESL